MKPLVQEPIGNNVSGVTGADLKKRIEHIMLKDVPAGLRPWKKGLLAAAICAATAVPFVLGVMSVTPLLAQQPSTDAAFDVTSVKQNNAGSGIIRMLPAANGGWQAENVTAGMLVRLAFQLQDNQIVGGPKWLFEDRFDVKGTGTAPGRDGALFDKLKSMLKDRFKLVTHVETREQPLVRDVFGAVQEYRCSGGPSQEVSEFIRPTAVSQPFGAPTADSMK